VHDRRAPARCNRLAPGARRAYVRAELKGANDMKAIWHGRVLAESDDTRVVEGNHYFPPDSLVAQYFEDSTTHTTCPWKGVASYKHVVVDGERNADAAWYYPETKPAADEIRGWYAFWRGVEVKP
jgi:uncharacterized protein (DUF427 family)